MVNNPLNFFTPQIIEKINSPYNGEIQVIKQLGDTKIVVNKMLQSGGLIKLIWKKGIKKILRYEDIKISRVLILGLGGGSVVKLVNQYFPQAKITAVEIDSAIINLAKKYFGLGRIKNLKIINKDAIDFITHYPLPITHYNLILIDLYIGDLVSKQSTEIDFLKQLHKILSKNGTIIINCLFYGKHRLEAEKVIQKAGKVFSRLQLIRAWSNLLVVLRK